MQNWEKLINDYETYCLKVDNNPKNDLHITYLKTYLINKDDELNNNRDKLNFDKLSELTIPDGQKYFENRKELKSVESINNEIKILKTFNKYLKQQAVFELSLFDSIELVEKDIHPIYHNINNKNSDNVSITINWQALINDFKKYHTKIGSKANLIDIYSNELNKIDFNAIDWTSKSAIQDYFNNLKLTKDIKEINFQINVIKAFNNFLNLKEVNFKDLILIKQIELFPKDNNDNDESTKKLNWNELIAEYRKNKLVIDDKFKENEVFYISNLKMLDLDKFINLTSQELTTYFTDEAAIISNEKANYIIEVLKSFNEFLEQNKILLLSGIKDVSPITTLSNEAIKSPEQENKTISEVRILNDDDLRLLEQKLPGIDWFILNCFLLTGISYHDYNALINGLVDYDHRNGAITITNENGETRKIFINDFLYRKYLNIFDKDDLNLPPKELNYWIIKINNLTKLNLSFELLQHTFANHFASNGGPIEQLSFMLGISLKDTQKFYPNFNLEQWTAKYWAETQISYKRIFNNN